MILPVLVVSLVVARVVRTQQPGTNATCDPSFDWSSNSLDQSPCQVAAYVGSACNGGGFFVPALTNDLQFYEGPTVAQANPCGCSSVFYSLLAACADCQNADKAVPAWSTFAANCATVYASVLNTIPSGTAVPHWAYQNVTVPGSTFNITAAQMQLNAPESTAIPTPTLTPSPSATPAPPKKSHAGPIAGGVVGGVVLISLICIAMFWVIRRNRRGNAPSNIVGTPMGYHPTGEVTPFTSAIPSPKLYDPSDPSTFPSSPSSGMYASARVQSPTYPVGNTATDMSRPQYSGAPEV